MRLFLTTCSKILKTRPSRGVSFKPPLPPLANGVLIASVMTTSSGFCEVLPKSSPSALVAGKQM